jgi:glycosyltransferase involved in cell wall biosynthesis
MPPLISFIIPTKNRQYTAVFAVASVLNIESNEIEVVVQDCSDDDSLGNTLLERFQADPRIKYQHTKTLPSLTENWNLAISHTTGRYICGIGDDDAVLSRCLEVAKWMDTNKVDAILPMFITYMWKDAYVGSFSNSRLSFSKMITGKIYKVDLPTEFNRKALHCGFGYTENLPNLYYGIVLKDLLERHKKKCGHYLSSTSFDVYNAIILPSYTNSFYYIDYPLTIRGASGKSNANRLVSKKYDAHFKEFKNLHIPETLPDVLSGEVSVAESTIVALQDIGRTDLIENMDLAVVYAKTAALNLRRRKHFFNKYQRINGNTEHAKKAFNSYFYKFLKDRCKSSVRSPLLKLLFKIVPRADYVIDKLVSRRSVVADDILVAVQLLENYLDENDLSIQYDHEIEQLITRKEVWD